MNDQRFILLLQDEPIEPWRPQVLDEKGLSRFFEQQHYSNEEYPCKVMWASETGEVWNVAIEWSTTGFDEDDYADTQGRLMAAGIREVGHIGFRVDGRA